MFSLHRIPCYLLVTLVFVSSAVAGELKLGRFFSDNMVVQRDKPVIIRGFADAGQPVTVTFGDQTRGGLASEDGVWTAELEPMRASAEGRTLTATTKDGQSVSIENVLVGDVFLFARQNTIGLSMGRATGLPRPAKGLRAIVIDTVPAADPQDDLVVEATKGWDTVTPETAAKMSEAAYRFGVAVAAAVEVPIGVIELNMGDMFPIGWLSRQAIADTEKLTGVGEPESIAQRMENLTALWREGKPMPKKEPVDEDPVTYPLYPAGGYNAVINPLRGLALKGIVLQLGNNYPYMMYRKLEDQGSILDHAELNRAYVQTYDIRKVGLRMDPSTATRVPAGLREAFNDPALPIGWVLVPTPGIATLADRNVEFRELQRQTAASDDALDLIVPGMETIMFSNQVKDEEALAKRSAAWATNAVLGKNRGAATGPVFASLETHGNTATLHFEPGTAHGLAARTPDTLQRFEVADTKGPYVPARATIDGEVIRIESDDIQRIRRARYDWQREPTLGLVNGSGLPAAPFRANDDAAYLWFHVHKEDALPEEYSLPASEWSSGDLTLINGQVKTFGYTNFAGWLGPVGIRVGPFGPNMGVRDVLIGSPAEGKLMVGDVIYSANDRMLGENAEHVMSAAITESETRERGGKLLVGVRRGDQNLDIELQLEVMGSYSPTAPYDCPKTDKIVAQLEEWTAERGGAGANNFLSTDVLFLLASGNPQHQGLVRRFIYNNLMDFERGGNNWYLGYNSMLLAEYYLATGDRNVLPALQRHTENLVAHQIEEQDAGDLPGRIGGWYGRRKEYRTYPTMPSAGLVCTIGLTLGREAGVPVDGSAYNKAIEHFIGKGAPVGYVIYGNAWRDTPTNLDPNDMLTGRIGSDNGKISIAAVLFDLHGEPRTAHYCSLISTFAFNVTYPGHGGNFWNNFWTPLGAYVHGRPAFEHFMEGHRWYRELNRMFDGSLITDESTRVGAGHGVALTVPMNRLRITGAPRSPFAQDAPEILGPALEAYTQRDYARAEQLVDELIASGTVPKNEMPTIEKLGQEARRIQASIDADLTRLEGLIAEGRFHEATLDLRQLGGVTLPNDTRLAAIKQSLAEGKPRERDPQRYEQKMQSLTAITTQTVEPPASQQLDWTPVVTEAVKTGKSNIPGQVAPDKATKWRMMVVENRTQAPDDWMQPHFDDVSWDETTLPISWRLNHTALLRTTFTIDDLDRIEGLRFRAWLFRQQDIAIYVNGKLIGRINNLEKKTANVEGRFKPWAVAQLQDGENTLAIATRQNWRWGMLFMQVYNDGFAFMLDVGRQSASKPAETE